MRFTLFEEFPLPTLNLGSNESNYPNISLYNLEKIPFHRGMSMAYLNINSLFAHIDELRVFISNNKVDISQRAKRRLFNVESTLEMITQTLDRR